MARHGRHGRAVIPFGKHKGTRIRLLPDSYLSWLTIFSPVMSQPQWRWLRDSVLAELKFRGLRADLAATPDPEIPIDHFPLDSRRAIRLDEAE